MNADEKIFQIIIQNYQSHKQTSLELCDGVNVIVGPSDSGKSAILRALRWLIYNKPVGSAFRSHWGGDTSVMISIGNTCVKRYKSDKSQGYKLDDKVFEAIRSDVPPEISKFVNISDLNFQRQLDRPFLIDNTPGEVAQYLNKIARLDIIDLTVGNLNSMKRGCASDSKISKERIETLETDLKVYDGIDEIDAMLSRLERLEARKSEIWNAKELVEGLLETHRNYSADIEEFGKIGELASDVIRCIDLKRNKAVIDENMESMTELTMKHEATEEEIWAQNRLVAIGDSVEAAIGLIQKRKAVLEARKCVSGLVESYNDAYEKYFDESEQIKTFKKTLKDEMPPICPLCGAKTTAKVRRKPS